MSEQRYADALIAILAEPWKWGRAWDGVSESSWHDYSYCPWCESGGSEAGHHYRPCAWVIAAKAMGLR